MYTHTMVIPASMSNRTLNANEKETKEFQILVGVGGRRTTSNAVVASSKLDGATQFFFLLARTSQAERGSNPADDTIFLLFFSIPRSTWIETKQHHVLFSCTFSGAGSRWESLAPAHLLCFTLASSDRRYQELLTGHEKNSLLTTTTSDVQVSFVVPFPKNHRSQHQR